MAPAMKAAKGKAMKAAMKAAMKPAMKAATKPAMKAAMKAMKVKKVSVIASGKYARAAVFKGKKAKTVGGLTKATLIKSKSGKIVSKAASARSKRMFAQSPLKKWSVALQQARKALGITGFCAVGGKSAQGKALHAKVKAILGK